MYRTGDGTAARAALAAEVLRRAGERPPPDPLTEDWSAAERSEYQRLAAGRDRPAGAPTGPVPALVRETLLSIGGDAPEDDELRRALKGVDETRPPVGGSPAS